jgi:dihydrofolate reductase
MRRVRYNVAASLDGFIADQQGGFDWIPHDPSVDFEALFAKVDTVLLGRHSYEVVQRMGGAPPWKPGSRVYVFSRTLRAEEHPHVTLVQEDAPRVVQELRTETGDGEIWLFGGGQLFASLVAARQVDLIEVTIVPVLLGGGTPLAGHGIARTTLTLRDIRRYQSGMVTLRYETTPLP